MRAVKQPGEQSVEKRLARLVEVRQNRGAEIVMRNAVVALQDHRLDRRPQFWIGQDESTHPAGLALGKFVRDAL